MDVNASADDDGGDSDHQSAHDIERQQQPQPPWLTAELPEAMAVSRQVYDPSLSILPGCASILLIAVGAYEYVQARTITPLQAIQQVVMAMLLTCIAVNCCGYATVLVRTWPNVRPLVPMLMTFIPALVHLLMQTLNKNKTSYRWGCDVTDITLGCFSLVQVLFMSRLIAN